MRPIVLLLALSGLLAPSFGPAQQPAPSQPSVSIAPGTRVRVRASSLVAPLIANFMETRADTLLFFEEGAGRGIWSVPFDQLQQVERSVGYHNMHGPYITRGALIGAGVGAVGGLLFAAIFTPSDPNLEFSRVASAGVGALVGAGVGAFVGSRRSTEQWATVSLPRRASVGRAGRRVGIDVTFAR